MIMEGKNHKRLKILFLPAWYPSRIHPISGIFIKKHAVAVSRYCDVAVLYVTPYSNLKDKNYDIEYLEEDGISTVRVYCSNTIKIPVIRIFSQMVFQYLAMYQGLMLIKEKFGIPDIIHVNVVSPSIILVGLLLIFKKIKGIPYVVTEHWSGYTKEDNRYNLHSAFLKKYLVKIIFKKSCAVITVSNFLLNSLKEHRLISNRCFVVPNAINIPNLVPKKKDISEKIKILTISLLSNEQKNISGLIKAFEKIASKYNNIELHIVGDGSNKENLINIAKGTGLLNKHIFFHGYIPNSELWKYFHEANFFVLNSNFETFSVATAEALAHGVPVVVTKCGGPQEFVTGEVGVLVERQNEDSLVEGIKYMIENWHKYDPVKLHNYAMNRFSYEKVGKLILNVYETVLNKKNGIS
ncbi:MAG: hypothetical protein COV98_00140 [Candidatus Altarchaeum sp. CG12_big_fil_rev_8_21_14_0_65_33_22]|nr:MAG: hypothetical protein COV98_00140 [Candidatus Altarchaeum sp. CG12_big_fil_rev_8_21_14_0_65_33_22]